MISYIIYDLTYMQNLKKKEGGWLTDTENRIVIAKHRGCGGWAKRVKVVKGKKFQL